MTTTPAFVRNGRLDVLAINELGHALYAPVFDDPARPANLARFNFLDPRSVAFYPDWEDAANTSVALLRTEAGRDPHDRALTQLVGELATRSDASAPGRPRTTCACTPPAPSTSPTPSSVSSASPST